MPAPAHVVISHLGAQDFRLDGLRPYAEYRDFGFAQASHGAMTAHVLRFVPGYNAAIAGTRHIHDVDFQMVYLFKGWISYEFEGVGPITMHPGDAWTQPPGIRHTVTGYSDDCELMELVMPVEYATIDVDPAGTTPDETTPVAHLLQRRAPPQRFVVSRPNGATSLRDFGFGHATGGMVEAHEVRFSSSVDDVASNVPADNLRLGYVLDGVIDVRFDAAAPIAMRTGSCWLEPPETQRTVSARAGSGAMFEVMARLPN
jgi:hypothetical protein